MQNLKTNSVAIGKLLLIVVYIGLKISHGKPITDEDLVIIGLGGGGSLGNFFSADAKKVEVK